MRARTLLVVSAFTFALAACGGSDDSSGGAAAGDTPSPTADAGASPDASAGANDASPAPGDASPANDAGPRSAVHFLGRFDTSDPAGPKFAWPGTTIVAHVTGSQLGLKLADTGQNELAVSIDGAAPTVITTGGAAKAYPLPALAGSGEHVVTIAKRTESYVGVLQFLGFDTGSGAIVPSPPPFSRRIEAIGDSITCGYGVLGQGPNCSFTPQTEDETVAWSALAAAQLHAAHTAIAYSGIGVYQNYGGSKTDTMPSRFERTLADDSNSKYPFDAPPPDVVVVNLGTNDFYNGDPGQPFQDAYVAFLEQVRKHYASAPILCALSPMLDGASRTQAATYLQAAVAARKAAGDARVSYFEFDEQLASDGYGCDYHPSATTQKKMAAKIAPVIQAIAGW